MTNRRTFRRPTPHRRRRARGTALIELVMIVPLIALIIGLTFFFGRAMVNQQHVRAAARYAAWRDLHNRSAVADGESGAPNVVHVDYDHLNQTFFDGEASDPGAGIRLHYLSGPSETLEDYAVYAGLNDATIGQLTEELALRTWPHGRGARVDAEFPSDVGLWNNLGLTGMMTGRTLRDGMEWRYRQARNEPAVRDAFLMDVDSMFESMESTDAAGMGHTFRNLYLMRF